MLPTGFASLDRVIGGFTPGQLIAVAGNMQMEFAFNLVERIGVRAGKTVLLCTGGTPREQIAERLVCCHAQIDPAMLNAEELGEAEWDRIRDATQSLYESTLIVDDSSIAAAVDLDTRCRQIDAEYGLECLFVSCRSTGETADHPDGMRALYGDLLTGLKAVAVSFNIPAVAFGLPVDSVGDCVSQLSDLTVRVECDKSSEEGSDRRAARMSVTGHRDENLGELNLVFWSKQMRFEEQK